MKRALLVLAALLLALAVGVLGLFVRWRVSYDDQFDALRSAIIARGRLPIVDQWRHEDITLEDFGFLVRSDVADFWIDITDDTRVRRPDDTLAGFVIQFEGDTGSRAISIYSPYWKNARMPQVKSYREFLEHAEMIVAQFKRHPPPVTNIDGGPFAEYAMYLRLRIRSKPQFP
jgi:hypothetical protein